MRIKEKFFGGNKVILLIGIGCAAIIAATIYIAEGPQALGHIATMTGVSAVAIAVLV